MNQLKLTTGAGYGALTCGYTASQRLTFCSQPCSPRFQEELSYAVYHYLRGNPCMRSALVRQSYRLRFARGKGYHRVSIPASRLELLGAWAQLQFCVTAYGVELVSVRISKTSAVHSSGWRKADRTAAEV